MVSMFGAGTNTGLSKFRRLVKLSKNQPRIYADNADQNKFQICAHPRKSAAYILSIYLVFEC